MATLRTWLVHIMCVNFSLDIYIVLEIIALEKMHSKSVKSGDPARFICGVIRGDDVTFSWTRNGNVLIGSINERIRINHDIDTSVLVIRRTVVSDAGNYSCIAKNLFSESRASAVLQVEGDYCVSSSIFVR